MSSIKLIKPLTPHPCGYFSDRQANSLYVDPTERLDLERLTRLNQNGFRRSGKLVYKPDCDSCSACQPVRIDIRRLRLAKRFRRALRATRNWSFGIETASDSLYPEYARYISERHADGSMYPPEPDQYRQFLVEGHHNHAFLVARENGEFRACLVIDFFLDGVSSVYCFFNPDYERQSPGTVMILKACHLGAWLGLRWHYLGFWIPDSTKMAYKQQFQPLQIYRNDHWQAFEHS